MFGMRVRELAGTAEAVAVAGEPAIHCAQELSRAREPAQEIQRPGPPDGAGDFDEGVGAAKVAAVGKDQAHFLEKTGFVESETGLYPRGLERGKFITAPAQESIAAGEPTAADGTLTVVEHP